MGQATREPSTALYVARQPILDEQGRVFGYELLYRGARDATSCSVESNLASASVLTSAVLDLGLETLTGGRPAFLNVTASLVIDRIDALVPPGAVVLELLETIDVTPELIDACRTTQVEGLSACARRFRRPGLPLRRCSRMSLSSRSTCWQRRCPRSARCPTASSRPE